MVKVSIPAEDAAAFADFMATTAYHEQERDYKDALHAVFRRVLDPTSLRTAKGARQLGEVFGSATPDLHALGLDDREAEWVHRSAPRGGLRRAIDNLTGGQFAFRNYDWIVPVIQSASRPRVIDALRFLLDDAVDLRERVEGFQDLMRQVRDDFRKRTGAPTRTGGIQLSFVATLLGGYDRSRYTFYHFGALSQGFKTYTSEELLQWAPAGEKYASACEFVAKVRETLLKRGVQARDMIDAQSFIWLSRPGSELDPATRKPRVQGHAMPRGESSVAATQKQLEDIVRGGRGQGFGLTSAERYAVEHYAMLKVKQRYEADGWDVVPVFKASSYDLHATRGPDELNIEVKGTTGSANAVLLTWRELEWARDHATASVLAVVHGIRLQRSVRYPIASQGTVMIVSRWPAENDDPRLKAIAYRLVIRKAAT